MAFTEQEINEGNELIANFMGYMYKYKAHEDFSDIGGLYSDVTYYSKHPIEFEFTHDDGRGEGIVRPENFKHDEIITIVTDGYGMMDYPNSLEYHSEWNKLMPVVIKVANDIELVRIVIGGVSGYCKVESPEFKFTSCSENHILNVWKTMVDTIKRNKLNK